MNYEIPVCAIGLMVKVKKEAKESSARGLAASTILLVLYLTAHRLLHFPFSRNACISCLHWYSIDVFFSSLGCEQGRDGGEQWLAGEPQHLSHAELTWFFFYYQCPDSGKPLHPVATTALLLCIVNIARRHGHLHSVLAHSQEALRVTLKATLKVRDAVTPGNWALGLCTSDLQGNKRLEARLESSERFQLRRMKGGELLASCICSERKSGPAEVLSSVDDNGRTGRDSCLLDLIVSAFLHRSASTCASKQVPLFLRTNSASLHQQMILVPPVRKGLLK